MKQTMKEKPLEERPYEKCLEFGAGSLSDAELLAVIIRSGSRDADAVEVARRILALPGNPPGLLALHHHTIQELTQLPGIGTIKAVQLQCIAELARRMAKTAPTEALNMEPHAIAMHFMEDIRHKEREEMRVVMFNNRGQYIHDAVLFQGTVNSALASPREIYLEALKYQAVNIVLIHNHPSGDPEPSREDILITRRIQGAGQMLGINLVDHIIIGDLSYTSMKERGVL